MNSFKVALLQLMPERNLAGNLEKGLEYCRRAADILHDSLKTNWSAVAGGASKSDEAALYAEYAIDFAALAMRYALLATATALDMQYEEERNKDE